VVSESSPQCPLAHESLELWSPATIYKTCVQKFWGFHGGEPSYCDLLGYDSSCNLVRQYQHIRGTYCFSPHLKLHIWGIYLPYVKPLFCE
jgi:hypothetical protein